MLTWHRQRTPPAVLWEHRHQGGTINDYNEIVINAFLYADRLPRSVEAFFLLDDPQCDEKTCKETTRKAHALFTKQYPSAHVPLLVFKPSEPNAPFTDAI